jgi:DNA-binding MarR family transcriptional regulator
MSEPRDSVDALVEDWRTTRPDLDFEPLQVISRLGRVRGHVDGELTGLFDAYGLGAATFGVLVTLARLDEAGGVSQRRLMDELGLTSGTISVRMDRLVAEGLVHRRPDPDDRRNVRITLSERGRELFERVVPAHLANERRLLAPLTEDERQQLAGLLRKLLVEFEGSCAADAALGLTLAPAHVAISAREAVGLPPVAGLLVRAVAERSPADAAGLRAGDVLAGVRCVADLYAAAPGEARLRVVRGSEERTVTLTLPPVQPGATSRAARCEHTV